MTSASQGSQRTEEGPKKSHFEVSSRLYVFYLFFFILPLCLCCSYPTFLFNFRDFFAPFFLLLSFLFSTVSVSLSFRYWELVDKLFPPDAAVFSLLKELSLPSFFPVCVHETPSPAFVPSVFCTVTLRDRKENRRDRLQCLHSVHVAANYGTVTRPRHSNECLFYFFSWKSVRIDDVNLFLLIAKASLFRLAVHKMRSLQHYTTVLMFTKLKERSPWRALQP